MPIFSVHVLRFPLKKGSIPKYEGLKWDLNVHRVCLICLNYGVIFILMHTEFNNLNIFVVVSIPMSEFMADYIGAISTEVAFGIKGRVCSLYKYSF